MKTLLATVLLTLSCVGAQADETVWQGMSRDRRIAIRFWCWTQVDPTAARTDRIDAVKYADCLETQIAGEVRVMRLERASHAEPERKD